jgi:hypothetical protein
MGPKETTYVEKNGINHIKTANEEAPYKPIENKVSPKTNPAIS